MTLVTVNYRVMDKRVLNAMVCRHCPNVPTVMVIEKVTGRPDMERHYYICNSCSCR